MTVDIAELRRLLAEAQAIGPDGWPSWLAVTALNATVRGALGPLLDELEAARRVVEDVREWPGSFYLDAYDAVTGRGEGER